MSSVSHGCLEHTFDISANDEYFFSSIVSSLWISKCVFTQCNVKLYCGSIRDANDCFERRSNCRIAKYKYDNDKYF